MRISLSLVFGALFLFFCSASAQNNNNYCQADPINPIAFDLLSKGYTLSFVQIVTRHGDRMTTAGATNPVFPFFPFLPFSSSFSISSLVSFCLSCSHICFVFFQSIFDGLFFFSWIFKLFFFLIFFGDQMYINDNVTWECSLEQLGIPTIQDSLTATSLGRIYRESYIQNREILHG